MTIEWFYTTNKQQMGPVSWDELRELANGGILKPQDMVWTEGMDEWVKAINQKGLFVDGGGSENDEPVSSGSKQSSAYTDSKPPPGRRKRVEEEEEDEEEDDKVARRKARKKEQERAKMAVGVKVGLILAGVLAVLFVLGCAGAGLVFLVFGLGGNNEKVVGPAPAPVPKGKGNPNPNPIPIGNPKNQSFQVITLPAGIHEDRKFTFQQGRKIVITANSQVTHPQTDVDLYVMQGDIGENVIVNDISIGPNSRVEFVVPGTGTYRVRIVNLGPGSATVTNVNIQEQ